MPNSYTVAVVVRIEILRTYDDIVNYVIRDLEYNPYMVIRARSFPEYFEYVSRNEMPVMFVAIWVSTELFLMRYISCCRLYDFQ